MARAVNFWVSAAMTWLEYRNPARPEDFPDGPAAAAAPAASPAPNREMVLSLAQAARESWRQRAACRRADPDLFFPVGHAGPALTQVTQARRLCLACAVRRDCLDWAMRSGVQHGIWGGLTQDDRASIRRTFTPLAEGV